MIFATAFFTTDSFTGAVVRDFSLENYREVLTPTYIGIIVRTVLIATLVTVLCILIAVPYAWFMARVVPSAVARCRGRAGARAAVGVATSSRPTPGARWCSPAACSTRSSGPPRATA